MNFDLGLFTKGIFMGIANLIPGVSGGTVAFISGIYRRLIEALESFFFHFSELKKHYSEQLNFLLIVGGGLIVGVFAFAPVINWLLGHFATSTYGVFVGLVLAGAISILWKQHISWIKTALFVLGMLIGGAFFFIHPFSLATHGGGLFLGGMGAALAMILPGISGAYLLVLFGQYDFIIEAVSPPFNWLTLIIVATGMAVGLLLFSKLLKELIERYYQKVIFLLSGFMIGSLPQLMKGRFHHSYFYLWIVAGLIFGGLCVILKTSNKV